MFLTQLANLIMGKGLLGSAAFWRKWYGEGIDDTKVAELDEQFGWIETIYSSVMTILIPILAIVGAAGVIWSIWLGIQMARADSSEKRDEAKKRLIGVIIGIVILVVLIIFFTTLFPVILKSLIKI